MNFINPTILWALTALAVPIIIHFFDFQRPKRVYFTNVRLLLTLQQSSHKGYKLKHWWVLIARLIAFTALVLAFAQPFIPNVNTKEAPSRALSIYIDNSLSMQGNVAGQNAHNMALSQVGNWVNTLSQNTKLQYLDNNFEGKDQYLLSPKQFSDRLTESKLSAQTRNLKEIIARQQNALDAEMGKKKLYIFSDFQKATLGDLKQTLNSLSANTEINLIPINVPNQANVYADSVWLEQPFVQPGITNSLFVRVNYHGLKVGAKIKADFLIENALVSTASVSATEKDKQIIKFDFVLNDNKFKKAVIKLNDSPIIFDNEFYFTLRAATPLPVFTASALNNSYVDKVYSGKNFFIHSSSTLNNINYKQLKESGLVVIQDFDLASSTLAKTLIDKAKAGASIVLFPSEKPQDASLQSFANTLNLSGLSIQNNAKSSQMQMLNIENPLYHHIFEKVTGKEAMPTIQPVINLPVGGESLISLQNGNTVLKRFSIGKGNVYISSACLTNTATDLAKHAVFVPIMYRLAFQAMQPSAVAFKFSEKNISVPLYKFNLDEPCKLVSNETEMVPYQQFNDGILTMQIPALALKSGYYNLTQHKQLLNILAFNTDGKESDLSCYSVQELKTMFLKQKNIKIFEGAEKNDLASELHASQLGISLWRWFLLLALVALLSEIVLVKYFPLGTKIKKQ